MHTSTSTVSFDRSRRKPARPDGLPTTRTLVRYARDGADASLDDHRLVQPAGTAHRVGEDRRLGGELGGHVDVLPVAPAASGEAVLARRGHAVGRRLDDVDDVAARPVALLFGQLDGHQLAREGSPDEHHPPVVGLGQRLAAGDETLGPDRHHGWTLHPASVGAIACATLGR